VSTGQDVRYIPFSDPYEAACLPPAASSFRVSFGSPPLFGRCRCGVTGLHIFGLLHCGLEFVCGHQRNGLGLGKVARCQPGQ
jgi:hypothetical protein